MSFTTPSIEQIAALIGFPVASFVISSRDDAYGLAMIAPKVEGAPSVTRGSIFTSLNGQCRMVIESAGWPMEIPASSIQVETRVFAAPPAEVSDLNALNIPVAWITIGDSHFVAPLDVEGKPVVRFTAGCEGLYGTVFKYRGKVFFANHTKLDAAKSKGLECVHGETFEGLGMVDTDSLFPADAETYPHAYNFMATKAGCVTGTRQVFVDDFGYITYLGTSPLLTVPQELAMQYPVPNISFAALNYSDFPGVVDRNLGVFGGVEMTLKQANGHLYEGFFDYAPVEDARMRTDETVTVYIPGYPTIKVVPPGFAWRNSLQGGTSSSINKFYMAVASNFKSLEEYDQKFLRFSDVHFSSLKEFLKTGNPVVWLDHPTAANPGIYTEENFQEVLSNVVEKQRMVAINFLLSCPPHLQAKAVEFYDEFASSIKLLVEFLFALKRNELHFVDPTPLKTVGSVLTMNLATDVPAGRIYQKSGTNQVYDVTDLVKGLPPGKTLVLLKEPHPRTLSILNVATKDTEAELQRAHGHAKRNYNATLRKYFYSYLSTEYYNTLYQMCKQATAYTPRPREEKEEKPLLMDVGYKPSPYAGAFKDKKQQGGYGVVKVTYKTRGADKGGRGRK